MQQHPVIIFDGVCNLCNSFVQFIIRKDPRGVFRFSSLQSDFTEKLLSDNRVKAADRETILVWENGKLYMRSTAVLRIARNLGWPYRLLYGVIIVPGFMRDEIYRWVARNRYKWFGKKTECMVPAAGIAGRFIN